MTWDLSTSIYDWYKVREFWGKWNEATGKIDIWGPEAHIGWDAHPHQLFINLPMRGWPASAPPFVARTCVIAGESIPSEPMPGRSLFDCPAIAPDGTSYVGEFGGDHVIQTPPIPYFRNQGPTALEFIVAAEFGNGNVLRFPCRSIRFDAAPWGAGCVGHSLLELHASGDQRAYSTVYTPVNNKFRLMDEWYGVMAADGMVRGWQRYRLYGGG